MFIVLGMYNFAFGCREMERSKTKTILRTNITYIFHDKTANRPVKSKDKTVEVICISFINS